MTASGGALLLARSICFHAPHDLLDLGEKEKPRLRIRKEPAGALSDAGKGFTAPGRLERGKAAVPNGRSEGSLPDPARARLIRTFFGARRKKTRGRKHSYGARVPNADDATALALKTAHPNFRRAEPFGYGTTRLVPLGARN